MHKIFESNLFKMSPIRHFLNQPFVFDALSAAFESDFPTSNFRVRNQ